MIDKNNFDKALEYLNESQKLDDINPEIYEKKGFCYYSKVTKYKNL